MTVTPTSSKLDRHGTANTNPRTAPAAMPGYYKRPEMTADVFDAHGYYRIGDIVAELAPDHLAISTAATKSSSSPTANSSR